MEILLEKGFSEAEQEQTREIQLEHDSKEDN